MAHASEQVSLTLPGSLVQQLGEFEKRLRLAETLVTVFGGLSGFFISFGFFFISDRFGDTPLVVRVLLTASGAAVCGWATWYWFRHWWWRRRDSKELARLIQRRYSRLGDSLLGAVELTEAKSSSANVSPALCRAALQQVAEKAAQYSFKQAVAMRFPRLCLWCCLFLFIIFIFLPGFLFPEAMWNTVLRWSRPFADVARYTFVTMAHMPREKVVAHGENFQVVCEIEPFSRWQPEWAKCRFERQPPIASRVLNGRASFSLRGQTRPGSLSIRIGDATRKLLIKPAFRPELIALDAEISLPSYLGYPTCTSRVDNGSLELLTDSNVRLIGTASRALKIASLMYQRENVLAVYSNRFVSDLLPANSFTGEYSFVWTDVFGLDGVEPYVLDVSTVQDEAPRVGCAGIERAIAILEDEVVKLEIRAEDDYGLQSLWVEWKISVTNTDTAAAKLNGKRVVAQGDHTRRELAGNFAFSPLALDIPEENTVVLYACASDFYPGRGPSRSDRYRIYVLSKARHAQLIQEKMEALYAMLNDTTREEERLLDNNRELDRLPPEELSQAMNKAELEANEKGEAANAEQLARLSKEARELLKEALRNTTISDTTLRRWAELTSAMKQIRDEMLQATSALRQARTQLGQAEENLDAAIKLEEKILAALQAMEQGIVLSIEDMVAKGFVNRLLIAASREKEISLTLREMLPALIGARAQDLSREHSKQLQLLATSQERNKKEAKYIQDDLAGFYSRTRIKQYHEVWRDMTDKQMTEKLQALANMVRQNLGVQAIETAATWEKQFMAWAEKLAKLQPRCEDGDGDGDGNFIRISDADLEMLVALMRVRQREESLREQTRLLDENKGIDENYKAASLKLSDVQKTIADDLKLVERKRVMPALCELAAEVEDLMRDAEAFLRKPQTDTETIAVETEIIELLSNYMSSAGGEGGSGQLAAFLQALGMQIGMGAGAGMMGGSSNAGGDPAGITAALTGSSDGGLSGPRSVAGLGGVSDDWPEEYRDVLEAYFRAIEKNR